MKKIISVLMVIVMLFSGVMSLSGCSIGESNFLTLGQWLMMINSSFGMESYVQKEPYISNITKENKYFEAVQIAVEWNVIDKEAEINPEAVLIWKEALVTLVNVGEFMPEEASEEEKIAYAVEHFDPSIRDYWMKRSIRSDKAVLLLGKAQKLWSGKTYDHIIEEVKYKEDVIDFTSGDNKIDDYMTDGNIVAIPNTGNVNLNPGDIYVLPQNKDNPFVEAKKVKEIKTDDKYIYITNSDEEIAPEDVAQDIFVEESFVPKAENAIIYDGNGNVISVGSNVNQQNFDFNKGISAEPLASGINNKIKPCYDANDVKAEFTVRGCKVKLNFKFGDTFNLGAKVEFPNLLTKSYQEKHPSQELRLSLGASLKNVKITDKIDYGFFRLKSASVRVDYEQNIEFEGKFSGKPCNKVFAPEYRNDGKFLNNLKKTVWKDNGSEGPCGAETIKIASIDLFNGGAVRICLDVNFIVSAEGSVKISLTLRGAKGIEYKNGNVRLINTCDKDCDLDLHAKIEATLGVGPALYVIGLKSPIIGLQISGGAGAEGNVKFNFADSENHLLEESDSTNFPVAFTEAFKNSLVDVDAEEIKKIAEAQGCTYSIEKGQKVKAHFDVCIEIDAYFILRVGVTDSCLLKKLTDIKLSWDIFNAKNGKLLTLHIDNGKAQLGYPGHPVECALKYNPFDKADGQTQEETTVKDDLDDEILKGDSIIISQYSSDLTVGGKYYIVLEQIPKNYNLTDIVCSSSDEKIATVNKDGVVTAVGEGSVAIEIKTKDDKYRTSIAISVASATTETFNPLPIV